MIYFLFLIGPLLFGGDLFFEANRAYEKGDFEKARQFYEELIASSTADASLYFNTGNASWRLGRIGWARYYWEKAERLAPGEEDIVYNLNLVRNFLKEEDPETFSDILLARIRTLISFNGLMLHTLFWTWLFLFCGLFYYLGKGEKFLWLGLGALFLSLSLAGLLFLRWGREVKIKEGVLIEKSEIYNAPGALSSQGVIAEGRKVEILEEAGSWTLIGIRDKNLKVWVRNSSLRTI